ncbi:MAG TPA: Fe-S cluster assembly protein SufD [Acidobacteriota bacterium]|nr:Fe-S cluster assembly protein SufD [Acidobacteriota bacterium]
MTTAAQTQSADPKGASMPSADEMLRRMADLYPEPEWLAGARRRAWDAYHRSPMPSRVTHLWRYTEPEAFCPASLMPPAVPAEADQPRSFPSVLEEALAADALGAGIYVREGLVWKTALDTEYAEAGVIVADLHEAAATHSELIAKHMGSLVGSDFGKYEALGNAVWSGGLFIHIPRGTKGTKPMHVVTSQPRTTPFGSGRLLVIVEPEAELTLIDEYGDGTADGTDPVQANRIVEIVIGQGARVRYIPVQNWNRATTSYFTQRAHVARGAELETVLVAVGAGMSKADCGAALADEGAQSYIFGLAIGDRDQHYDHRTVHEHRSGHTQSDIKFKVALRDTANSAYTGLIRIDEKAAFCEAYQENRNLILSPGARAETIPELEILNNEVHCSHGATVGRVDDREVFYLQSRGLDRAAAVRLIVSGFVGPILDRVPEVARDRLRDVVMHRLEGN